LRGVAVAYIDFMIKHVNLVKLCVGADSPDDLSGWQSKRFCAGQVSHVTRMWPRREAELLAGGSIYWVFRGTILARQLVLGLEERIGEDNIRRCALLLDKTLIRTAAAPRRPFQGWRYLAPEDAPPDLPPGRDTDDALPPALAAELAEMGLR